MARIEGEYMQLIRKIKLQHRIIGLVVILIVMIVLQTSILFYHTLSDTVEKQIGTRALHVATTVAGMNDIKRGFLSDRPWETIQPIAERVRQETGAEYIVVGNKEGVRYAHPVPDRIGKKMVGGDNDRALVGGEAYISKATGSLGPAIRGKAPIRDSEGNIIGIVSAGFLMEDIHEMVTEYDNPIYWIAGSGLIMGVLGSVILARSVKKQMFGFEPEEIATLYQEHHAVLQSVREGIMVINEKGRIMLVNQAAHHILSLPSGSDMTGRPVLDVLPNSSMLEVLHTGEKQLDRQMDIGGKPAIVNRLPVILNEKVIGVVSSFRLKSEIDQLTEELSQVKRYTEALRAQTHEFNNLLYTISGLIQLESYEEALELIHRETADHQDFVQFIMKKMKDPWIGGILLGFYSRARELKIDFELDRDSCFEQIPARLDGSRLVSILGNLITNAFESVEKLPEQERKVRLYITDVGDELLMEVEDSGSGVPDDMAAKLFNKGFSTKNGRNRGNGLARVKELLEEWNGSIAIERGDLKGALFIAAIPKGEV